jgi:pectin methylesterase-like acyl-CoA thioesterase
MRLKAVSGIVLTLLFVGMLTLASNTQPVKAEPRTWTVDDDGPADFSSIQEAINAASPGDTIFIKTGTYYEHVVVNKTVSLIGEERLHSHRWN